MAKGVGALVGYAGTFIWLLLYIAGSHSIDLAQLFPVTFHKHPFCFADKMQKMEHLKSDT